MVGYALAANPRKRGKENIGGNCDVPEINVPPIINAAARSYNDDENRQFHEREASQECSFRRNRSRGGYKRCSSFTFMQFAMLFGFWDVVTVGDPSFGMHGAELSPQNLHPDQTYDIASSPHTFKVLDHTTFPHFHSNNNTALSDLVRLLLCVPSWMSRDDLAHSCRAGLITLALQIAKIA